MVQGKCPPASWEYDGDMWIKRQNEGCKGMMKQIDKARLGNHEQSNGTICIHICVISLEELFDGDFKWLYPQNVVPFLKGLVFLPLAICLYWTPPSTRTVSGQVTKRLRKYTKCCSIQHNRVTKVLLSPSQLVLMNRFRHGNQQNSKQPTHTVHIIMFRYVSFFASSCHLEINFRCQ